MVLPYQGIPYKGILPKIGTRVFLAPSASVIGDVEIDDDASIWFGCVLRGDVNVIRVGARTNIQDGTVIHVSRKKWGTFIGADVTIGHSALIHACTLEDTCFIGMRATIMDGAVVEGGAMVAAGALITPGKRVRSGELWAGTPARAVRPLSQEERDGMAATTAHYVTLAHAYLNEGALVASAHA